jgi:ABC-2 type transport system permease protein
MNPTTHAIRTGLRRGWTELKLSLKSPQDQGFYLFMATGVMVFLWFNRDNELEGTGLFYPSVAMPSILGAMIVFGLVVGPGYSLAMEREDGTLLRSKAVPGGILGYVSGQVLNQSSQILPSFAVILVPGMLLFDGLMHRGLAGWVTVLWVTVLGILAVLPIGMIVGSLVPGIQRMGTWGILPVMILGGISGIFFPIQGLWAWVQGVAQVFPMYWLGLGMRSAFLPDAAKAIEIGDSWRTTETVVVLAAWAVVGIAVAPRVLRRMAQRQSGSQVEAAREQALQWVK